MNQGSLSRRPLARELAFEIPPVFEGYDATTRWTAAIKDVLRRLMPQTWRMIL